MTYFEARRAAATFREFRQLALKYWASIKPIDYGPNGWMAGPDAPTHDETEASAGIRRIIATLQVEVQTWAARLGVSTTGVSFPPPVVGGPSIPVDYLAQIVERRGGYHEIPQERVLDAIDRCIGAAEFLQRRLGLRMLNPLCWLVDIPALIVGWPFAVMRKAGVPDKIVESTGAQVIKAVATGLLSLAGFVYAVYKLGLGAAIQSVLGK